MIYRNTPLGDFQDNVVGFSGEECSRRSYFLRINLVALYGADIQVLDLTMRFTPDCPKWRWLCQGTGRPCGAYLYDGEIDPFAEFRALSVAGKG